MEEEYLDAFEEIDEIFELTDEQLDMMNFSFNSYIAQLGLNIEVSHEDIY
jgi:hypothetical protein